MRERQVEPMCDGRLLGVGIGSYVEQTAHTSVFSSWGVATVPGYEQATVRLAGRAEPHGVQPRQGTETSMAQVAYEVLGIDPTITSHMAIPA